MALPENLDNAASGAMTATTTPAQLVAGDVYDRTRATLQNRGSVSVYLGRDLNVSASTAFLELRAGETCEDESFQGDLWLVAASSTATVGYQFLPPLVGR